MNLPVNAISGCISLTQAPAHMVIVLTRQYHLQVVVYGCLLDCLFPPRCVGNAACLAGPAAPQAPVLPEPFDQFGPIGFCQ